MQLFDWIIVAAYLVFTLFVGIYLSRKASGSLADFFVSGRSLPWWLAGTSMAATTFSIDTPLVVAGLVATKGIAGNWLWWSFGFAHIVMIYIFARLWRRSEIITDAELTEMRYGGNTAAVLRGTKAFLFAVPINCIGIGYAMLAMVKMVDALGVWQSIGIGADSDLKLWTVIAVSIFVLIYAGLSGLWGVVATDFFQFFLALVGALIVAVAAVQQIGGINLLVEQAQQATNHDVLSFVPLKIGGEGGWLQWSESAGISINAFFAYIFLQWWSFRRSDGGGEFVQRLAAAKDEQEAEKSAWLFNIMHYVVRTWPWILVGLAAVVLYPDTKDQELGYFLLMKDYLPQGLLGLVFASLVAAFMSTVSTSINWGASYLTNDLYLRFMNPQASQAQLISAGRVASVLVTLIGAIAAFYSESVVDVFKLVIAIGTGPGLVLILRWYWWRINAAAELASMLGGFLIGLLTTIIPVLKIDDFGLKLLVTTSITTVIWVAAMLLTPPESEATLNKFYAKVRPGGPGWTRQQSQTGLAPLQDLGKDILRVLASSLILFGSMFTVGGFLLLQPTTGWISLVIAVIGWMWLRQLNKSKSPPMVRPGTGVPTP
ncbi:sodium:solute symporter family protein [Acaryochloris sp. CCMEE 5410]|uniref:sodium:solute symporter family protein n=1 Tax=Acaryochloris sp. CCMEE 5410 TaxID=310037 RepID=UPI000248397E|nr:sodium:solute symporter family protein [Acaryochloris sp. CCMEE 5410]KAI9135099.1 Na+:solute symporter [Acaryochloris sp. CCMEE 5410]